MGDGIVNPEPAGAAGSVGKIRELLLDVNKSPLVQIVGGNDWIKLIKVGVMYRNCK